MDLDMLEIDSSKSARTRKINILKKQNIHTIEDLARTLPRKYYDFRNVTKIKDVKHEEIVAVVANVLSVTEKNGMVRAKVTDGTGNLHITWFNQARVYHLLKNGGSFIFCGKIKIVEDYHNLKTMEILFFDSNISNLKKILPVYKKMDGLSEYAFKSLIKQSLALLPKKDYLDNTVKNAFGLIDSYEALKIVHNPKDNKELESARKRMIFDDLFQFNFKLKQKQLVKENNNQPSEYKINSCKIWNKLYEDLPFTFSEDQSLTIKTIYNEMKMGNVANYFVQGDVGSGKTIVALFLMAVAAENGFQSVLMAPTDILATQHYEEFKTRFKDTGINVVFLSGSLKAKQKRETLEKIKNGEAHIIIGTHSLVSQDVEYNNLGLAVVDEEHRFGVLQREEFMQKSKSTPHFILMSATPIPRTLASTIYGEDVKCLEIKTRPAGRKPIITKQYQNDDDVYAFMHEEIKKGHQCYVVCPLVNESESESMEYVKSVAETYEDLCHYYKKDPSIKIGIINGKMKKAEANEELEKFAKNEYQIIVATTIVEVGVNVPNSTVIAIKNSERFGLATLHQLRGRVGRSSLQSYCILQTPKKNDIKAKVMCSTTDGFVIAQKDLEIRGPGSFLGTRQSGDNKYLMLMLAYPKLNNNIRYTINKIYENPKWLELYKYLQDLEFNG